MTKEFQVVENLKAGVLIRIDILGAEGVSIDLK